MWHEMSDGVLLILISSIQGGMKVDWLKNVNSAIGGKSYGGH